MARGLSLDELIRQLDSRGGQEEEQVEEHVESVLDPLLYPPETFNEWLERTIRERQRWIDRNADELIDCASCGLTHRVGRLWPDGGCRGPAPPEPPQPVAPEPEPEPELPFPYPPPGTTRARPSGARPKVKKQQVDHDAEWEAFRTHRTSLGGGW